VSQNILLHGEIFRNIRTAFTTTVYAFLNPGRPSAAWDFFLPEISCASKNIHSVRTIISFGYLNRPLLHIHNREIRVVDRVVSAIKSEWRSWQK
jgi:hypothetical protein